MKISLLFLGSAFGAPIGNMNDFLLPYLIAKRINWSPPSYNMPNFNFNPIDTANKEFLTQDVVPAYLANRYDNTSLEAMNWYLYMKKNHPNDLKMINNLVPLTFLSQNTAPASPPKPYVPSDPINLVPEGYEGQSFGDFDKWGESKDFFKGSNNRFPGK